MPLIYLLLFPTVYNPQPYFTVLSMFFVRVLLTALQSYLFVGSTYELCVL